MQVSNYWVQFLPVALVFVSFSLAIGLLAVDDALTETINDIYKGSGNRYGAPKIHAELADDHEMNRAGFPGDSIV